MNLLRIRYNKLVRKQINKEQNKMMKFLLFAMLCLFSGMLFALEITKSGQANVEIVVEAKACNSIQTAALELQKYIEKISGAKLPIVNSPTGRLPPVFIGPSQYTNKLGITLDDIKYDGFKIIATDRYLAIVGRDVNRKPIPRDNTKHGLYNKCLEEWQKFTGRPWRFHFYFSRDSRNYRFKNYNERLSFHDQDATGTLYGVYEFLEKQGVRWFMPIEDIGTVIPKQENITVEPMQIKQSPSLAAREMMLCSRKDDTEFLWFKRLRQGGMFDHTPNHSSMDVLDPKCKEEFVYVSGKPVYSGKYPVARLASEKLRSDLAEYILRVNEAYPEISYNPIGQPDGWIIMDDRDKAKGWDKISEGDWGRFSDYMWDFVMDVRKRVLAKRPGLKFNTMSYSHTKNPPKNIDKIPADVGVYITQTSPMWWSSVQGKELKLRKEWERRAPESDLFIYDYYLSHNPNRNIPAIPAIFTKYITENFHSMNKQYKGSYVEIAHDPKSNPLRIKFPGVNHLMYYLHGKLSWNKNADVQAILADYYEKFFGPAAKEMREFYEFAEEVWMRPISHQVTAYSGFVKKEDIDKYFEILERAKAKAGNSIYGKRIDFIINEMQPVKTIFKSLNRTDMFVRARVLKVPEKIDGDLNKDYWTKYHPREFIWMKDIFTAADPKDNKTFVRLRWHKGALIIGVTCMENRIDNLTAGTLADSSNDNAIFNDDNIEIYLETPEGYFVKIAVNPNGAIFCKATTPDVAAVATAWRPDAFGVKKLSDRWTAEFKISGIGKMPTKAIPWGINICRQRKAGNARELFAVSPTDGPFSRPEKRANLWCNGR